MIRRVSLLRLAALTLLLFSGIAVAQQTELAPSEVASIRESDLAYPYRLIPTTNIWTQILIDTATGRAWQVQFSIDETPAARAPLNEISLLPESAISRNGRFAVYPTSNMYTFLLMDREDSRIWQLQWSNEPENRGIMRSIPLTK